MKNIIIAFLLFINLQGFSQDVNNDFLNFKVALYEGKKDSAVFYSNKIIVKAHQLSTKNRAVFYYKLAVFKENKNEKEQAINFYTKSLNNEPNYFVAHLALAYLYSDKANAFAIKINALQNNKALRDQYISSYQDNLKKALPHFEKAMACDPNDQVLNSIKRTYSALKTLHSLTTLENRLKILRGNCIDVLPED